MLPPLLEDRTPGAPTPGLHPLPAPSKEFSVSAVQLSIRPPLKMLRMQLPPRRLLVIGVSEMTAATLQVAFFLQPEAGRAGAKDDGEQPLKNERPRIVRQSIG